MEDLKFRAWDKRDLGGMLKWDYVKVHLTHIIERPHIFVLQQYIGAKDKNGIEIYEGDIVKTNENSWVAKVIYQYCRFICEDNKGCFSSQIEWENCEVISHSEKLLPNESELLELIDDITLANKVCYEDRNINPKLAKAIAKRIGKGE